MLAEDGVGTFGDAEGVLEFATAGEDFAGVEVEADGFGSEAAGTAEHARAVFEDADYGIVDAHEDVAIVGDH